MRPAPNGNTNSVGDKQGSPRAAAGSAETVPPDDDTTFDQSSPQPSGRRLGPLLGGLATTIIVILTFAIAAVLGSQEGRLVAGVGSGKSTATPSPFRPSATAVPSTAPSPYSTPVPSLTPTQAFYPGYTPAASCPVPSSNWQLIVVQSGETLAQIAGRYKTKESVLYQVNCLQSTALYLGQTIYVPPIAASVPTATRVPIATKKSCVVRKDWVLYTIKPGDTLSSIAARVGLSVKELKLANCLVSDTIYAGNQLRVPYLPPVPTATKKPTGAPPSDTPSGEPPTSTSLPPSDTPLPPSDSPLPPSDTPIPPPSDTPMPPPSDTPIPPPSDTPIPPPSDTPLPPPSDTPRPTTPPKPSDTPIPPEPPPMAPAP